MTAAVDHRVTCQGEREREREIWKTWEIPGSDLHGLWLIEPIGEPILTRRNGATGRVKGSHRISVTSDLHTL